MPTLQHRIPGRPVQRMLLTSIAGFAIVLASSSASAEGLFDFFFGGAPWRSHNPPSTEAYTDPNSRNEKPDTGTRYGSGSSVAHCVRLCDGRYFPIQRASGVNAAQVCSSFCPTSRTKIFWGSVIGYAAANDGTRYTDLPNAFAYRDRIVADCTCNGKDAYGLVTSNVTGDPTLQPGDIVATDQGFVAYNGGRRSGDFTPIESYGGLSAELRRRLAGAQIMPRDATPVPEPDNGVASANGRRSQVDR